MKSLLNTVEPARFLGRSLFNHNTMMWTFADGSGSVPDEMRRDMELAVEQRVLLSDGSWSGNGAFVLGVLFSWKERLRRMAADISSVKSNALEGEE